MKKIFFLLFIIIICPVIAHAQAIGNQGSSKAYADAQDAVTLAAAEDYADGLDTANSVTDQAYTDSVTANMAETDAANTFPEPQTFTEISVVDSAGLSGILSIPSSYAPSPIAKGDGWFFWDSILCSRVGDTVTEIVGGSTVYDTIFAYTWKDVSAAEWSIDLAADFTAYLIPNAGTTLGIVSNDSATVDGAGFNTLDFVLEAKTGAASAIVGTLSGKTIDFTVTATKVIAGGWIYFPAVGPKNGPIFGIPQLLTMGLGDSGVNDGIHVGATFAVTTGAPSIYINTANNNTNRSFVGAALSEGWHYFEIEVNGPSSVTWTVKVDNVVIATEATEANSLGSGNAMTLADFADWNSRKVVAFNYYMQQGTSQAAVAFKLLDTHFFEVLP